MSVSLYIWPLAIVAVVYSAISFFNAHKVYLTGVFKKAFSFISVMFALIALELGGSMMLGTCEEAYTSGFYGILYVIGISIGFLLLGFGFASRMKAMNVENTLDLFETTYKSPLLRMCASFLSILTIGGLLISQIIATKSLIHGLGIKSEFLFLIFFIGIIAYTIVGGLRGAGLTYQAQLIYTVLLFGGIFSFCIYKEPPSFFYDFISIQRLFPESDTSFSTIFASLVMPALYYLTDQEFARPLFEISNTTRALALAVGASVFMLVFSFVPIYFGIKAKMLNIPIKDDMNPLIGVLTHMTNEWVVILAACGILAALVAVIDYYLWSLSMSITHEAQLLYKRFPSGERIEKIMIVVVGLTAFAATYCTTSNAIQTLLYSYELYDSCLIVPLIMSYFQPGVKKEAAISATLFGLSGFVIFRFYPIAIPREIASLSLSFLGFYMGNSMEKLIDKIMVIPWYAGARNKIKLFILLVCQVFY